MNKEKYLKRQNNDIERGEYERKRRIKYLRLKRLGQYLVSKRSEVSKEIKQSIPLIAEQDKSMYLFLKTIIKAIKYPLLIALGLAITGFIGEYPMYAEMTVGGILIAVYDIIKHKVGIRLP